IRFTRGLRTNPTKLSGLGLREASGCSRLSTLAGNPGQAKLGDNLGRPGHLDLSPGKSDFQPGSRDVSPVDPGSSLPRPRVESHRGVPGTLLDCWSLTKHACGKRTEGPLHAVKVR